MKPQSSQRGIAATKHSLTFPRSPTLRERDGVRGNFLGLPRGAPFAARSRGKSIDSYNTIFKERRLYGEANLGF